METKQKSYSSYYEFPCSSISILFIVLEKKWVSPFGRNEIFLSSYLINQCYLHLRSTLKTSTASNSTNESLEVTAIKSHFFSVEKLNNGLRIRGIRSTNTRCEFGHSTNAVPPSNSRKCEPGLRDYQIVLSRHHIFSLRKVFKPLTNVVKRLTTNEKEDLKSSLWL